MFDPNCVNVRALAACAVSGGQPISKELWGRLVGLGSPIRQTLSHAVEALTEADIASVDGEFVLVGSVEGTLCDVIRPYLLDEEESKTRRMHLRRGLSCLLDLDRAAVPTLIDASRQTPLREASVLPCRILAAGERLGLNELGLRSRFLAASHALETAIIERRIPGFAVPLHWLAVGGEDPETSAVLEALAHLWVSGTLATMQAVVDHTGLNPGTYYRRVNALVAAGKADVRETWRGQELVMVNLRDTDPDAVSLADALPDSMPEDGSQARYALKALRSYLGLPVSGTLDVTRINEAAKAVPLPDLRGLPLAVENHYLASGRASKTGRNAASAIRALLREACIDGRIPMVWTERLDDDWDRAKETWFPTTDGTVDGASVPARLRYRFAWSHLREAVTNLWGEGTRPTDLDTTRIDAVVRWLRRRGRWDHAQFVHASLAYAGQRDYGPLAEVEQIQVPSLQGGGNLKTLDGFISCLRANALGEEWEEFFRWYYRYSTMPDKKIRRERDMPSRPRSRRLRSGSFANRFTACRLVLGVLRDDGHDLRTMSPKDAFSVALLRPTLDAIVALWDQRYAAGDLESPCGTSIRSYVASAGLIAEALYRRARGTKAVAPPPEDKPRWGLDPDAEEGKTKSELEQALWDAYRDACALGDALKDEAKAFGSSDNTNTVKDLEKILRATPPKLFDDLQAAYLDLARRSLEEDGSSTAHHRLILSAFTNGFFVSTGCRGQEGAHVRLDIHCPPEFFDPTYDGPIHLTLRAVDRKNSVRHTVTLRPTFVPAWLRQAFIESRCWLMEKGELAPTDESFGLDDRSVHQHLIVSPTGRAYGSPEEDREGAGRIADKALERRVNMMRDRWKNDAGRVLWAHTDWECPVEDGMWTLHVIRNVKGYSYYQIEPLEAANYLGDRPVAIREAYSSVGSHHISATTAQRASKWDGKTVARDDPQGATVRDLTRELAQAREANRRLTKRLEQASQD